MASPGLKRPLEFELPPHTSGPSGNIIHGSAINGKKRRCNNFEQQSEGQSRSLFRDPAALLSPLNEDISSMIDEELRKTYDDHSKSNETPVLTIRQTQIICEKLVRDREQKLREEYDRILACKLAEQYDMVTKANYINSYLDTRLPTNLAPNGANPSINALAAAFTSMQRSSAANTAAPSLPDLSTFAASLTANGHPGLTTTHLYNLQQQAAAATAIHAQSHRASVTNSSVSTGPVLLASNLDEQLATPEALFTLCGVFGDVIRVKILFNKKDNALIQMADANQAQVAQGYLDKQKVFGKIIRVTRSKHQLVQMPRDGNQSDAGLTKDFTNSPLHRFKIPGSRNYLNIYPPSNTLHISNIPANIDENELHRAFKEACGFEFSSFKFFPKDRKMALMKFNSIEHATIALIKMHNFQISEDNNLRVSFSKTVMQSKNDCRM